MMGYKKAEWWRKEEREKAGCKLAASFNTRVKEFCERDKLTVY
jgi:hypothetical protein